MALLPSEKRAELAAAASSSTRTARPGEALTASWERTQGQVARALMGDTELVYHFAYLATNRLNAQVSALLDALVPLMEAIEGMTFPDAVLPQDTQTAAEVDRAAAVVAQVGPTATRALTEALERRATTSLAPAVRLGSRVGVRGTEARTRFGSSQIPFFRAYARLLADLSWLRDATYDGPDIQRAALVAPLATAQQVAAQAKRPTASDEWGQVAAAAAALRVVDRPTDPAFRVRMGTSLFPEGIELTPVGTGAFTAVRITPWTAAGVGIRVDDVVRQGMETTRVIAVESSTVTFAEALSLPLNELEIASPLHAGYASLQADVDALLRQLPMPDQVGALLAGDIASAADSRRCNTLLGDIARLLKALPADAQAVLLRQGAEIPAAAPVTVSALLTGYAPATRKETRTTARALLDALELAGFNGAVAFVLQNRIGELCSLPADQARASENLLAYAKRV